MNISYFKIQFPSSEKIQADNYLTKILDFTSQSPIKKVLKFPNVDTELYAEITKNWLIGNKEFLINKLYLILENLAKEKMFEFSEELQDLHNEIRLILEQTNSQIFAKNQNLFATAV